MMVHLVEVPATYDEATYDPSSYLAGTSAGSPRSGVRADETWIRQGVVKWSSLLCPVARHVPLHEAQWANDPLSDRAPSHGILESILLEDMLLSHCCTAFLSGLLVGSKESWLCCSQDRAQRGLTCLLLPPGQPRRKHEGF